MKKTAKIVDEFGDIEVTFDDDAIDDMEVIDMIGDLSRMNDEGNENQAKALFVVSPLLERLFGHAQKKRIYDHFRDERKKVRIKPIFDFIMKFLAELSKKN